MGLEFRQYVTYNWDTASIVRSTKWVILGFITPALHDICMSQSDLLVQISNATFNTEMFDSQEKKLNLSFFWGPLPDFIRNLNVVIQMNIVQSCEETLQ